MPDLDLSDLALPDLARGVTERTQPPPFEAVLGRAARRRRTRVAAVGLATALVVGAGAGVAAVVGDPARTPEPSSPASSAAAAAGIIADPEAGPVSIAPTERGDVAVLWQSRSTDVQAFALRVDDGPDVVGTLPGQATEITAVPDGWLVTDAEEPPLFLSPGGELAEVPIGHTVSTPGVGDRTLVWRGLMWIYSHEEHRLLPPPLIRAPFAATDVVGTPSGRMVAACSRDAGARKAVGYCTLSGGPWTYTSLPSRGWTVPGMVAASGEHVAVTTLTDSEPMTVESLRLLDGDSVEDVDVAPTDVPLLHNVGSMAVLADGSTAFANGDGQLVLVSPDGELTSPGSERVTGLVATGDRLWAHTWDNRGPLIHSDDHGRTWHRTPMPGLAAAD